MLPSQGAVPGEAQGERSSALYCMDSKNSMPLLSAVRVTMAFFQAGVRPSLRPIRFRRPRQFMVLTAATLVPGKMASTARPISILPAPLATRKVYFRWAMASMEFSVIMGARMTS